MNDIENLELSTESHKNSSSSSDISFEIWGLEGMEDKGYFNQESLSEGLERTYGVNLFKKTTRTELSILTRYWDVVELINEQKVFHVSGMINTFGVTQSSLYKVRDILVKRRLLRAITWAGKAKSTFGMVLYVTKDCPIDEIKAYLIDPIAQDKLRYEKQLQRSKKTKTPEEIVKHNEKVKELSKLNKKTGNPCVMEEEKHYDNDKTQWEKHINAFDCPYLYVYKEMLKE